MWNYERRLEFPVNIKEANADIAQAIISQYGGPDGEMGASMRYLSQRYACPYREVSAVLTDIGVSVTSLYINQFHLYNFCYITICSAEGSNGKPGCKRQTP